MNLPYESVGGSDPLNLDEVRGHLVERLSKGEHDELVDDILKLLEKLGRRTAHLEFELMRLRKSAQGRTSERIDTSQLSLLLSLVSEADKPQVDADDESETVDPLEDLDKFEARIDSDLEDVDAKDIDEASAQGEPNKPARRQRPPEHFPVEERGSTSRRRNSRAAMTWPSSATSSHTRSTGGKGTSSTCTPSEPSTRPRPAMARW